MREILFRGFHPDSREKQQINYNGETIKGKWTYGHYFRDISDLIKERPSSVSMGCTYWVLTETVSQYIGLEDKNGKRIFEGDIFKFDDEVFESCYTSCGTEYDSWEVENYGVVGFDEDLARYDFCRYKFNENSVGADLHENNYLEFSEFVRDLEIVGNIHDNSELLEGKQ